MTRFQVQINAHQKDTHEDLYKIGSCHLHLFKRVATPNQIVVEATPFELYFDRNARISTPIFPAPFFEDSIQLNYHKHLSLTMSVVGKIYAVLFQGIQALSSPRSTFKKFLVASEIPIDEVNERQCVMDNDKVRHQLRENALGAIDAAAKDADAKNDLAQILVANMEMVHILTDVACEKMHRSNLKEIENKFQRLLSYCPIENKAEWEARYQFIAPRMKQLNDQIAEDIQKEEERKERAFNRHFFGSNHQNHEDTSELEEEDDGTVDTGFP